MYEAQLRRQETTAENPFRTYLSSLGLTYQTQYGFLSEGRILDFYLPDHNLIIGSAGPYHDPERDRQGDEWFTRMWGTPILRLTNDQVINRDFRSLCTIFVR